MWFLASREVRHAPGRFGLLAGLVALIGLLVFVMTGLTVGLGAADVSGLTRMHASVMVFARGAQHDLGRSDLPDAAGASLARVSGVTAATPIGFSMAQLTTTATGTTATGTAAAVVAAPSGTTAMGATPMPPPGGIELDVRARGAGLRVGDVVRVQPGGIALRVEGFAALGSIQHADVGYVSLATWQRLPAQRGRVSGFAVATSGDVRRIIAAIDGVRPDVDATTLATAIRAVPGYQQETGVLSLIRGFLYGGTAFVMAAVFWIVTLQNEGPLAVLRATGASRRLLVGAYLIEVLGTACAGMLLGAAAGVAIGAVMPVGVYVLEPGATIDAAAILLGVALLGAAVSLRRLLTVDPLLSLGRTA